SAAPVGAVQFPLGAHHGHAGGQGPGGAVDRGGVGVVGGVHQARQRHGGEQADDDDGHHQFQQGEAPLRVPLHRTPLVAAESSHMGRNTPSASTSTMPPMATM